jgi:hypothetical protein
MTIISNSTVVRCTPEEAFDYLSDHRSELEWNPGIESIEKLTDGPICRTYLREALERRATRSSDWEGTH